MNDRKINRLTVRLFMALTFAFLGAFFLPFGTSLAAESKEPVVPANRNSSEGKNTFISAKGTGYILGYVMDGKLFINYLDSSFEVAEEKSLDMELPVWGGFYEGEDAYYVAEGAKGVERGEAALRVIKYDKNWSRLGAVDFLYDSEFSFRNPITQSGVEIKEMNGKLYLASGYSGYSYGEGSLLIEIDKEEMTGKVILSSTSSSFRSFRKMAIEDDTFYLLEKNGKERRAQITVYDGENEEAITVLKYGGENSSTYSVRNCYASVDGMEFSETHILTVGTSIDQSIYDEADYNTAYNIYLTVTPRDDLSDETTGFVWLTDHEDEEICYTGLEILRISDDRFLIMWQELDGQYGSNIVPDSKGKILHYCYVDGSGNLIGEKKELKAALSTCRPVLSGSEAVWCASNGNKVAFYRLNTENDNLEKTEFHSAGEGISWTLEDGTLTFTGTGVISAGEYYYLNPLASYYTYSSGAVSYGIWTDMEEPIKNVVISEGITGIADNELSHIGTIEKVEIPSTMKSVGESAFIGCTALNLVYIKSFDCTIGEDAFWYGRYYYSGEKAYRVTIACEEGSTADEHAKENGIRCRYILLDTNSDLYVGAAKVNGKWKLFGEDGMEYQYPWGWIEVDGKKYYFDDEENLCIGWKEISGAMYHFSETTAAMDTGFHKFGKNSYFFEEDGSMATRWKKIGENYYYFGNDGVMKTGWVRVVGRYFYLEDDGVMYTGWYTEKGKTYYMNEDGVMLTGIVVIDGETCIFANNGALIQKGTGSIPKGWKQVGDQWVFFQNGERVTGWQKIGGKYYYFELDGIMRTGWRYLKTKWYYLDPASGAMKTGWLKLDGKWYFFDPSGYMVKGTRTIQGKKYEFAKNGECLNP